MTFACCAAPAEQRWTAGAASTAPSITSLRNEGQKEKLFLFAAAYATHTLSLPLTDWETLRPRVRFLLLLSSPFVSTLFPDSCNSRLYTLSPLLLNLFSTQLSLISIPGRSRRYLHSNFGSRSTKMTAWRRERLEEEA